MILIFTLIIVNISRQAKILKLLKLKDLFMRIGIISAESLLLKACLLKTCCLNLELSCLIILLLLVFCLTLRKTSNKSLVFRTLIELLGILCIKPLLVKICLHLS